MTSSRELVGGADEKPSVRDDRGTVIVSSMASDSHTWNLVFLQLLIEELGYHVVNLGPCVPDEILVAECRDHRPDMVVISSVNGHGYQDGMRVIERVREQAELAGTPTVIGGKLGVSDEDRQMQIDNLMRAGFDGVFDDGSSGVAEFRNFVHALRGGSRALAGNVRQA